MKKVILVWAAPLSALFVFGPLGALLVGLLRAEDGGEGVSILIGESPVMGLFVLLGSAAIAKDLPSINVTMAAVILCSQVKETLLSRYTNARGTTALSRHSLLRNPMVLMGWM